MMKFAQLLSLLTLLIVTIVFPARADTVFNAQHFTLDNGMKVILIENHRAPIVTHMIWYKVGAADEPWGQSGIAHFLEHLMFKGTETLEAGEFSEKIRALGGRDNAFTSQDYTAYFQTIAAQHLETVMKMEAERMNGLSPSKNDVKLEHKVILEERRQNIDNYPKKRFYEKMQATLFPNHPYGTPIIGWMKEMQKLNWEQAYAFYEKWYAPNNAILIVSGDVTLQELKPLAEKIYGVLPREDVPDRHRNDIPTLKGETRLILKDKTVHQPVLTRIYRVPSHRCANRTDVLALQLLEEILGGGATTRLYKTLVVEKGQATTVDISYDPTSYDCSTLWINASPVENVLPETLEASIDEILSDFSKTGPTETELIEAKKRMKSAAIYARDSVTGPAMVFGHTLSTGGQIEDIEYWPEHIDMVTAEQVKDVAARYLDPSHNGSGRVLTGILLPEAPKDEEKDLH